MGALQTSRGRGSGFAGPQAQRPPRGGRELREANDRGGYFSQPRFLKYHIGTTALAAISASA